MTIKEPSLRWRGITCDVVDLKEKCPTIAWGTLGFEAGGMAVTCKVVEAANAETLEVREPESVKYNAVGETVRFLPYECTPTTCHVTASASYFPLGRPWLWEATVSGSEEYGETIEGVKLTLECPGKASELAGTFTLAIYDGATAGRPAERVFKGPIKGRMKVDGYEGAPLRTPFLEGV